VEIKEFWSERAGNADLDDVSVTHRDIWQRWLEIETIRKLVKPDHRVIDVGCGAGYCSRKLAPSVGSIVGVDFAPEMIARARQANSSANASFHAHDVLELSPDDYGMFDVARVIHPLLVQPEAPSYEASINEIGASLALNRPHDLADISRVVGLVLRKK
jgi:ubiquinone/menaquinone biosynthesis C-methylase UbiE